MYFLHNLHAQESGFHCLIVDLNKSKVVDALIWENVLGLDILIPSSHNLHFSLAERKNLIDSSDCIVLILLMHPYKSCTLYQHIL